MSGRERGIPMKRTVPALAMLSATILAASLAPTDADAFHYYSKCGSKATVADKELHMGAGKKSFPSGHARRDALLTAQKLWNDVPSHFIFSSPSWNEEVGMRNHDDEIWFTDDSDLTDGKPGMAHLWFTCYINEVDIVYLNTEPWSYTDITQGKTTYKGSTRPWITGALHELGHAFGLAHVNDEYNIMGSDATHVSRNDDRMRYYAGEDGADGQIYLYGESSPNHPQDVSVTHWKYGSASGEYSKHVLTTISSDTLPSVPSGTFGGMERYNVLENYDYQVEFTYENNGRDFQNDVDVGYYISTNPRITTADTLIKSTTMNIGRDNPATLKKTVHLPELKKGQTYWLGVIVDRTQKIAEVNESNNATSIPILVTCCD